MTQVQIELAELRTIGEHVDKLTEQLAGTSIGREARQALMEAAAKLVDAAADESQTETVRLAADVVALSRYGEQQHVLVIERRWKPFQGRWALPGGHVDQGEDFEAAARRELREETGIDVLALQRVDIYSKPGRDPRGRYVSVAYAAVLDDRPNPVAGDDARVARWVPVDDLLVTPDRLAFDHHQILADALALIDH